MAVVLTCCKGASELKKEKGVGHVVGDDGGDVIVRIGRKREEGW